MAALAINKTGKVQPVEKMWLSNAEAQAYLGMGADFLKDLRQNAKISFYKVSHSIFYKKTDIDKLITKGRVI